MLRNMALFGPNTSHVPTLRSVGCANYEGGRYERTVDNPGAGSEAATGTAEADAAAAKTTESIPAATFFSAIQLGEYRGTKCPSFRGSGGSGASFGCAFQTKWTPHGGTDHRIVQPLHSSAIGRGGGDDWNWNMRRR